MTVGGYRRALFRVTDSPSSVRKGHIDEPRDAGRSDGDKARLVEDKTSSERLSPKKTRSPTEFGPDDLDLLIRSNPWFGST